jgi:hypothetical protein
MRGILLLLAPLALLTACGQLSASEPAVDPGTVYAVPLPQAHAVLKRAELPPMVFGDDPPTMQAQIVDDQHLLYIVKKDGSEIMRYTVTLSPAEAGATRVAVELTGAENSRFGNIRQRLEQNPTVKHLYLVAMREEIASDLEQRNFDMTKLYGATAAATAANMDSIMDRFDRAAEEDRRRSRENMEKAYRDEARGRAY